MHCIRTNHVLISNPRPCSCNFPIHRELRRKAWARAPRLDLNFLRFQTQRLVSFDDIQVGCVAETRMTVLDYDRDCASEFGKVRVQLRRNVIELPSADLLIASVALVYDLTLVTHNTADFQRIPGLRLDDWLTP